VVQSGNIVISAEQQKHYEALTSSTFETANIDTGTKN